MTPEQIKHAKHVNRNAASIVADYVGRRAAGAPVDAALVATAEQWRIDVEAFAVYLRSRVPADAEALRAWLPFLWIRSDECNLV